MAIPNIAIPIDFLTPDGRDIVKALEEYLHAVRYGLLDKWESTPPEATPFAPQVASQQNKEKGEKQHEEGSNRF